MKEKSGGFFITQSQIKTIPLFLFVFVICSLFQFSTLAFARPDNSVLIRDQKLTTSIKNAPLQNILRQIAEQAEISVVFHGSSDQAISMEFVDVPIEKALRRLLSDCNYSFLYQENSSSTHGSSILLSKVLIFSELNPSEIVKFEPQPEKIYSVSPESSKKIESGDSRNSDNKRSIIPEPEVAAEKVLDKREAGHRSTPESILGNSDRQVSGTSSGADQMVQIQVSDNDLNLQQASSPDPPQEIDLAQETGAVSVTGMPPQSILEQPDSNPADTTREHELAGNMEPEQAAEEVQEAVSYPESAMPPGNDIEEPVPEIPEAENNTTDSETETAKYTMEEFTALSDEGKRDVYYNFPQRLPDNFDPLAYTQLFHNAQESGE